MEVRIRPYRIADHAAMIAMEAQVASYRPEDQPAVDAMYQRANKAKEADTGIWMPTPQLPNRTIAEEFNAFWVAEAENGDIVGMAGGQQFLLEEILPLTHSLAKRWQNREQVAELRRLRVAESARRRGLGKALSQTVIAWAQEQGYPTLLVNTTSPQLPALTLYRSLGFQDVGLSYMGEYEIVWMEMRL